MLSYDKTTHVYNLNMILYSIVDSMRKHKYCIMYRYRYMLSYDKTTHVYNLNMILYSIVDSMRKHKYCISNHLITINLRNISYGIGIIHATV